MSPPGLGWQISEFFGKRLIDVEELCTMPGSPISCQATSAGKGQMKGWLIMVAGTKANVSFEQLSHGLGQDTPPGPASSVSGRLRCSQRAFWRVSAAVGAGSTLRLCHRCLGVHSVCTEVGHGQSPRVTLPELEGVVWH